MEILKCDCKAKSVRRVVGEGQIVSRVPIARPYPDREAGHYSVAARGSNTHTRAFNR